MKLMFELNFKDTKKLIGIYINTMMTTFHNKLIQITT